MGDKSLQYFLRINGTTVNIVKNKSIYFSKPRIVAIYDIDYEEITPAKKIKYFRKPDISEYPIDLNDSFDTYRFLTRRTETRVLHSLLHIINSGVKSSDDCNEKDFADEHTYVYCRSGIIKHIMEFYYGQNRNFSALISRYDGKLFIIKQTEPNEFDDRKPVHTHHRSLAQLLFVDTPNRSPDRKSPIDENISQVCVHTSNLGKYNITYAGEVQGIIADYELDNVDDINVLNEARFAFTKQMWSKLKGNSSKLLNYWLQAYLANVGDIYMAYKDKHGVVQQPIEHMKVADIPKNCYWKPGICSAFLHEFLDKVERLMSEVNSLDTVYEFQFNTKRKIIYYKVHLESPENAFIPKEYSEFIKK